MNSDQSIIKPKDDEKKLTCDVCEEEWEESFFCKTCGSMLDYDGDIEMLPDIFWDGSPGNEFTAEEPEARIMDVCLNCCGGHPSPAASLTNEDKT